jgi:hypothetical protein
MDSDFSSRKKKKERPKASRTTTNGKLTDLDPGLVTKDWSRATIARKLGELEIAPTHSQETTGTRDAIKIVLMPSGCCMLLSPGKGTCSFSQNVNK